MDRPVPGLFFDVVATTNIELGEEIFLDYGLYWERAWKGMYRSGMMNREALMRTICQPGSTKGSILQNI